MVEKLRTTHVCFTCLFVFLMIKDTLLPTVQKTHIGKYRTFPNNQQTAIRNSLRLQVPREGSTCPSEGGKVLE